MAFCVAKPLKSTIASHDGNTCVTLSAYLKALQVYVGLKLQAVIEI